MTSSELAIFTFNIIKESVKTILPSAVVAFLVVFAVRLSWSILRGSGLK